METRVIRVEVSMKARVLKIEMPVSGSSLHQSQSKCPRITWRTRRQPEREWSQLASGNYHKSTAVSRLISLALTWMITRTGLVMLSWAFRRSVISTGSPTDYFQTIQTSLKSASPTRNQIIDLSASSSNTIPSILSDASWVDMDACWSWKPTLSTTYVQNFSAFTRARTSIVCTRSNMFLTSVAQTLIRNHNYEASICGTLPNIIYMKQLLVILTAPAGLVTGVLALIGHPITVAVHASAGIYVILITGVAAYRARSRSHLAVIAGMITASVTGLLWTLIGDASIIILTHVLCGVIASAGVLLVVMPSHN